MRKEGANCPNCGAPMKGGRCEYCGTEMERTGESYVVIDSESIRFGVIIPENYQRRKIERGIYI